MLQEKFPTTPSQSKENLRKKEEEEVKKEFDAVLKDRFPAVPSCNIKSEIPGVDSISIINPTGGNEGVNVKLFYNGKNREGRVIEKSIDGSIAPDGILSMRIPSELKGITQETVLKQVLKNLKEIGIGIYYFLDDDIEILPPGDLTGPRKIQGGAEKKKPIDKDRFTIFTKQPEVVMGLCPGRLTRIRYGKEGRYGTGTRVGDLSDYHTFIFPKGMVFENAVCENAIFYSLFEGRIPDDTIEKIKKRELSREEMNTVLEQIGFHTERVKGKKELRNEGKRYGDHPDMNATPQAKQAFYNKLDAFIKQNFV